MNKLKFIFYLLSNIGFIVLIPVLLHAFGISAPIEFLESRLGVLASVSVLTLVGFILIAFQVFFGGGDHIRSTILGFLVGFLLVSTAVEMGFMLWFKDWVAQSGYFDNLPLNYLMGILVVFMGIRLSHSKTPNFLKEASLLLLLPASVLYGSQAAGIQNINPDFSISLNSGMANLRQFIDENYQNHPEVKDYIEEVDNNEDLNEEEKIEKIKELQLKIDKLEKDQAILKNLQEDNKLYEDNMGDMKNANWCSDAKTDEAKTQSFAEAVTPNKPCVRDFAVNLAKKSPGPYSQGGKFPGPEGIKQICSIHLYLSNNWKYISDPTSVRDDYYSTASRSLAIGMAGDCDDYSVVMASSIQAIGGTARIAGGLC
ncbi:MAG: hypothetical protein NW226_13770 [Microscillaceae bacterium]|nr:hypothetical protein [Microscillaceae bacterium]